MLNTTKTIAFQIENPNPNDIVLNSFEFLNQKSSTHSNLSSSNPDLFSNQLRIHFLHYEPIDKYIRGEKKVDKTHKTKLNKNEQVIGSGHYI